MDDKRLRQDILDELDFEPSIDAANIGVAVDEGVVTLTGHVASYAQKTAAEEAVRRVKGVLALANEVEIRYPGDKKTSDGEIAKRALSILKWNEVVPKEGIQISVERGWVILTGQVTWQFQRKAAEEAVRKLSGVLGVINDIEIKPAVSAYDVKEKIESALTRHAEIEAQEIKVTVRDGNKVLLEGKVDNLDERMAVENAAWSVAGVKSVDDRLTITPLFQEEY
ncbi:MAG TPA: BON domain-containing protein [Aestuariivirgaceae bacterium]